ncbi:GAF domain-containing sensor histidine kinase [Nocardioides sp. S5]|uniref:GAF domain-containing sensor histidine kinase n=1 Tax=Nocardioides sp. S5 TaxID=2017486 RepID=UPI001A8EB791|nr:GAF domain-containing sensor histidine kinase [Nocardioides sp. S5]
MIALEPGPPYAELRPEDVRELMDRQTAVLELIARAAPLAEVLTGILTSLEDLMPGARCSVLLLDHEHGTLHHGAAPSLPPAYVAAIDGIAIGEGAGSCGTAAALNAPVVATDVLTDVRWVRYRDIAVAAGLRSCWSTPIDGGDGRPVGTFAVYHSRPHGPSSREQLLVDRFTHLASIAIGHAHLLEDGRARLEAETARRTAEELSHAKSELLAAVGHEARTPIQAIVGFAELLGTMDLDEARRREALAHIGAAAGHVMDLLSDVLDMSRLEANALPLGREPVLVRDVVVEVLGLLSTKAAQRRVTLEHHLGDEVVLADRRRLRQVVLNLVANAIRHGHTGGRVEVRVGPSDADAVVVLVDDDGPGIPSDLLGWIFTPFARGAAPRCTPTAAADEGAQEESIGLGLGLAHGLARAMGGDLDVARSGPSGTSMRLLLPRADAVGA